MKYIALSSLFLCCLSLSAIGQEYAYGDRSTKKYYSITCSEVSQISQVNLQGFQSSADAEKAGYSKGQTCRKADAAPIIGRNIAPPKRSSTITVGELRKDAVTIEMIETEFGKYVGSPQKYAGRIKVSADFYGKYARRAFDMWAFDLCDGTSCGTFYMSKGYHSDTMRSIIINPVKDKDLFWTCQYQPEQIYRTLVIGLLLSCEAHELIN